MTDNAINKIFGQFGGLPLELEVEMGRTTMKLRDIHELTDENVVVLERSAGENMSILIGGTRIGYGEVIVLDNILAIRITELEDPAEPPRT